MKKNLFKLLISIVFTVSFIGCGEDGNSTQSLGHHPKDTKQSDFDPTLLNWEVDNNDGLRIHVDNSYIYMQFDHSKETTFTKNIQFLIDIDNNTTTGNKVENGADYIVENGYLYKSLSRDKWNWKEIGKTKSDIDGLVDTIKIDISKLENKGTIFSVNAEVLNDKWEPVLYSPAEVDENGNHKKTVYIP